MATGTTPPATAAPDALIVENTTIWICLIDGMSFSVAADTPETQIRETLSMQYPGARDAQITYDKVIIDGQQHKRLLFTKRGGTKGCPVAELVARLARVPAVSLGEVRRAGSVDHLMRGTLTFDQLLVAYPVTVLGEIIYEARETIQWERLAALPPVAGVITGGSSV